jgi:hypothetical protein
MGVVSRHLCTASTELRSRQLVGTIRGRGAARICSGQLGGEGCEHYGSCCNCWVHDSLGMGSLGRRPAGHGRMTGTEYSHMGRFLAGQYAGDICRQQGQVCFQWCLLWRRGCSDPGVTEIVNISACFGDVQFRWATKPFPIVGCHMCRRQFVGTACLDTEFQSYYIRLVGRASLTSALNLIAAYSPQDICAHGSLPATVFAVGGFIHGHHAPWANRWHGKLGHGALRACLSRIFSWSGKPGHGGDLRTIGCDAGRWLAQPLGAQSPFTSPRCLTVRIIFARGCG